MADVLPLDICVFIYPYHRRQVLVFLQLLCYRPIRCPLLLDPLRKQFDSAWWFISRFLVSLAGFGSCYPQLYALGS
jgi:hypothetical protein